MSDSESKLVLIARLIYGGVLTYMAVDGFRRLNKRIEIAGSKGVPMPERLVPLATGMLLTGSIGILFWRLPRLAAGLVATFFAFVTPKMHAFWKVDPEDRRGQRSNFLKNSVMFAGALLLIYIANQQERGD